jgi:hypothetical protein
MWSISSATRPDEAAEVVGALIDHPAVRRINFTGSTAVGRIVAATRRRAFETRASRAWRQGAADRARRPPISTKR